MKGHTLIALALIAGASMQTACQSPAAEEGSVGADSTISRTYNVMFYNVENLFDTIDDPNKDDNEFLPGTDKDWNSSRYMKKISDLGKVISALDSSDLPAFVGLCEVENARVLNDLIANESLSGGNYGFVHNEGPDVRGIDVAAIYRKEIFEVLSTSFYTVTLPDSARPHTRQVLYCKGNFAQGGPMHLFVSHWPSRRGGAEESEHKRVQVATLIREKIDSIEAQEQNASIIVMGDLNDHPDNRSVTEALGANGDEKGDGLYNALYDEHMNDLGTYNYRGDWGVLDQFIFSRSLLDPTRPYMIDPDNVLILDHDWLLYHDEKYDDIKPSRTYGGPNYYGGYSDHLPIMFQLEVK